MILAEQVAGTVDWWARGVGAVALLIALGGLGWNVYHSTLRDRAKIAIKISLGFVGAPPVVVPCLSVEIANSGRRPCTIESCKLECSNNRSLFFMPGAVLQYGEVGAAIDAMHKWPRRLEEGEAATVMFPRDAISQSLKEDPVTLVSVCVTDGTNKNWRKVIKPDIAKWLENKTDEKVTSK